MSGGIALLRRRIDHRFGRVAVHISAALAAALLGSALTPASQAQPGVVVVTPEPVGFARQFVTARSVEPTDSWPDLGDARAAGLEPAKPGSLPAAPRAPIGTRGIEATTTFQLMQSSQTFSGVSAYRPLATQIALPPVIAGPIVAPPMGGGSTPPPSPTGAPSPTPVDPQVAYMREMQELQERERRAQLQREQQARVSEMLMGKLKEIEHLRAKREEAAAKRQEELRDVRGPSALAVINLFDGLYVDRGVELDQSDILRIDHHIYQDANPDTGLFYYAPKRYDLQWDPQNQYAMTVIYGMAGQKEGEGEVFMATRLQAGVDLAELRLTEDLLLAYLRRSAASGGPTRFRELRPLPLAASSDVELFGGASNEFSVPPDKISVQGITSLLDSMDVSWATDVRRLLNVESLLRTDAGIHGSITMHASGQEKLSRAIPLEIAVASHETFGRIPFDRANGWVNRSHYPIRLDALHALLLAPEDGNGLRKDQPVVLTWDLHDAVIPPGVAVSWNSVSVPSWLEGKAKAVWIKYGVDGNCDACDDLVFTDKFIPPPPSTREIQFTTGDVFEVTGAYQIRVYIRSPFLDPQHTRILEQPAVVLDKDGNEFPIGRIFLTQRELTGQGAHEPFYEFRVDVVMRDGKVHQSGWVASRTLDYLLGSASLREILGKLPGEQAPAS
jgi:hypothetical protein